jgi:hypothetical protein
MTAPTQTRTTIGQLVYRAMPPLDFARLAADLDAALVGCDAGRLRVVEERDDLAVIDVGASRVAVGIAAGLDRKGGAAVIVTVGYGEAQRGDASLARRQSMLARLIAERITARFAPQETVWTTSEEVATPALFDRLREELAERRQAQIEARADRARARRAAPLRVVDAADVSRMFQRLDATLAARRTLRPEAGEEGLDFGPEGEGRGPASAPIRLAAHLIDATLMVIALPIGAAMMIYGLTRGADIHTSARALALSGTGIGVLQLMGGVEGLQRLLF